MRTPFKCAAYVRDLTNVGARSPLTGTTRAPRLRVPARPHAASASAVAPGSDLPLNAADSRYDF